MENFKKGTVIKLKNVDVEEYFEFSGNMQDFYETYYGEEGVVIANDPAGSELIYVAFNTETVWIRSNLIEAIGPQNGRIYINGTIRGGEITGISATTDKDIKRNLINEITNQYPNDKHFSFYIQRDTYVRLARSAEQVGESSEEN